MPASIPVKVAVLDDYQGVSSTMADWGRLEGRAEIVIFRDHVAEPEEIVARLKPFDVVCVMRERTPLPGTILERLPRLKLIVSTGRSNASIDAAAAARHGIVVCGTGSSPHAAGAAELTWALILALLRNLPAELAAMREGRWQTGVGGDLAGKTIGIVGLGNLGSRVARVAQAFDMNVIAWSDDLTPEEAERHQVGMVTKRELFSRSDIVTVHLVLSPRSLGIIGAADLAAMKPTAWFVNTSRGPLVDEAALIDVLRRRAIAGAAVDVYDVEPLPARHPFRQLDNLLATPHIGFVTRETYQVYFRDMVEDIAAWLDGAPVRVAAV